MGEIKNDERFKNINFENKNDEMIIKSLNKIIIKAEKVKIELSYEEEDDFFIQSLNGKDDFNIEIKRSKYEELCMDLWEKCFKIVDKTLKLSK